MKYTIFSIFIIFFISLSQSNSVYSFQNVSKSFSTNSLDGQGFYFADYLGSGFNMHSISIIEFKSDTIFIFDFPSMTAGKLDVSIGVVCEESNNEKLEIELIKTMGISLNAIAVMFYTENCGRRLNIELSETGNPIREVVIDRKLSRSKETKRIQIDMITSMANYNVIKDDDPCIGEKLCCDYNWIFRYVDYENEKRLIRCR